MNVYDFQVLDAEQKAYDLAQHKGYPLLIYNVASGCEYAKGGFEMATTLYNRYKDRGFTVLAFPCNQFGEGEHGTGKQVKEFACTKFKADFPIMAKVNVNGKNSHPLYEYLKKTVPGVLGTTSIKWNFTSFLVDANGIPVARFSPGASVEEIEKKLIPLLAPTIKGNNISCMMRQTNILKDTVKSIFQFQVNGADHQLYNLAQHKGYPLLIYNVASKCGYAKGGYETATALYNKYKDRGFTVLAFPCNQFGGQEPGTEQEVKEFACTRFKADFPIMAKVNVNGENSHPLYEYLKKTVPGVLGTTSIKWNFTSFLVDANGIPVARFSPGASVEEIEKKLIPLLEASRL